jgi:hypothetical protein
VTAVDTDSLARGWAVLSIPDDEELQAYDLDQTVGGVACRIALDRLGVRHLLVPLAAPQPVAPTSKQTLEVSIRWLQFEGQKAAMLDLSCADLTLGREFDEVIADVLSEVDSAQDAQSAAIACIGRWRQLFRSSRFGGLTPEGRIGLFAELSVLLGLANAIGADAIPMWTGPLREKHDFELAVSCLEVKGVGGGSAEVTIHGIDQLAPHGPKPLRLLLVWVESTPDGATLDDLIGQVRAAVDVGVALDKLLEASGWTPNLFTDQYVVGDVRLVAMTPEVPALTPVHLLNGALATGVDRVRYNLLLNDLVPFGAATTIDLAVKAAVGT